MPIFRDARRDELPAIVALLADDTLGAGRETAVDDVYRKAFDDIAADPGNRLIVADAGGQVAGTLQLTLIPGLSRHGMLRAQIESVRIPPPGAVRASAGKCSAGRSRRPAAAAAASSS